MVQRGKPRRPRAASAGGTEWVGGRRSMRFYVTEGDPYRPEMIVWLQLPEGLIVAHDLVAPGEDASIAASLRRAIQATGASPQRIRVADELLAGEVRAAFGDRLDVRVAPTPELDALFADLARALPEGGEPPSYFEDGLVEEGTVARMFRAAEMLYRAAPWKVAGSDQALRLDIPALGVEGACVSIIGQLGESFGLIVFPSYVAFERILQAASDGPPRSPAGEVDLGTSVLSLDFERGADVPPAMRAEIARHGWSVAGPKAFPIVMRRDRDGVPAPVNDRDVRIATECAFAVASFVLRHREVFEAESFEPVCESSGMEESGITVRLTAPYDAHGDFDLHAESPAGAISTSAVGANKVGRNEPCPCGSGKKYKKCCLAGEQVERVEGRRHLANHELDNRLVESIHRYAMGRFGEAWRSAVTDIGEMLGEEPAALQLLLPWTAYTLEMDGRPVPAWLVEERGRHLAPAERVWLEVQRDAWLSVWEVIECEPGVGVVVRDLLSGETRRVTEVSGSRSMVRRDAVLGRVVVQGDVSVFCGMFPRVLPPDAAAAVVARARRRLRSKGTVAPSRLRNAALGRALIGWWAETVRECEAKAARPPKLHNTDGDELLLTTDHFAFNPGLRGRMEAALRTIEGVVPPDDGDPGGGYDFARPGNAMHAHWDNTIVGRASVADDGLRVETNSIARADRLRGLIEEACGGLLRHRAREHADPLSKTSRRSSVVARENEPPGPEAVQALLQFKQAHYRSWLDEPVPALGGKTPRQATRTERGRAEVDLLLRTMENHEQRGAPEAVFDFAEVRRELQLPGS